jgi:hypothetical protein
MASLYLINSQDRATLSQRGNIVSFQREFQISAFGRVSFNSQEVTSFPSCYSVYLIVSSACLASSSATRVFSLIWSAAFLNEQVSELPTAIQRTNRHSFCIQDPLAWCNTILCIQSLACYYCLALIISVQLAIEGLHTSLIPSPSLRRRCELQGPALHRVALRPDGSIHAQANVTSISRGLPPLSSVTQTSAQPPHRPKVLANIQIFQIRRLQPRLNALTHIHLPRNHPRHVEINILRQEVPETTRTPTPHHLINTHRVSTAPVLERAQSIVTARRSLHSNISIIAHPISFTSFWIKHTTCLVGSGTGLTSTISIASGISLAQSAQ